MRILLTAVLLAILPQAANASFQMNCETTGTLSETENAGTYTFVPKTSFVTDGYSGQEQPCMQDKIGKELLIELEGDVVTGPETVLMYRYYNAMGENGVVEGESWAVKE